MRIISLHCLHCLFFQQFALTPARGFFNFIFIFLTAESRLQYKNVSLCAQHVHSGACEHEWVWICLREKWREVWWTAHECILTTLLLILITPQTCWANVALFFTLITMSRWLYSSYTVRLHKASICLDLCRLFFFSYVFFCCDNCQKAYVTTEFSKLTVLCLSQLVIH